MILYVSGFWHQKHMIPDKRKPEGHMKNGHPLGSTHRNLEIISENSFIYLGVPKRTSWSLIPDANHGAGIFTYKTGWFLDQMLVHIPYMEHLGISLMRSWDTSWLNQSHMLNSFTLLCSTPISMFSTDFLQERWIFVVNPQRGQRLNWPMSFFYGSLAPFFVLSTVFKGQPVASRWWSWVAWKSRSLENIFL